MSAYSLAQVVGALPYAAVMWNGEDGSVATVLCRIDPAHEPEFEQVAFRWMDALQGSKLLVAKQLLEWKGAKGYLWNISLWSKDTDAAAQSMSVVLAPEPEPEGPYIPPHMRDQVKGAHVPEEPVEQTARRVLSSIQEDPYSPNKVQYEKGQGEFKVFTVPLAGARGLRNIPRPGSTKGAHSWSGKRPGS